MKLLASALLIVATMPPAFCQHKTTTSDAGRSCHKILSSFEGKDSAYFENWESSKTSHTLDVIDTCARESYDELTRFDLALAVVITGWLKDNQRTAQVRSLSRELDDWKKLNAELISESRRKPTTASDEYSVTIETIPTGLARVLRIAGRAERCSADGPQSMSCEKYVEGLGYLPDAELVVMIARVNRSYGTAQYLIGCPASRNCAPLVPGEYRGKIPGGNAIVIADLVAESSPDAPPHHGIYTILDSF